MAIRRWAPVVGVVTGGGYRGEDGGSARTVDNGGTGRFIERMNESMSSFGVRLFWRLIKMETDEQTLI